MSMSQELETDVQDVLESRSVQKAKQLMQSRSGVFMLALISFIESALPLPLLTDPFLIAAILLNRAKVVQFILVTTIASVVGGLVAYFFALFFLDVLLVWLRPETVAEFYSLASGTDSNTIVLTLVGALTPVPYTLVAWVAAVIEGRWFVFMAASLFGRGFRYTLVGYLTYRFGPPAVTYAKRYLSIVTVGTVLLALAYVWYKM